jgi:hypothetical protein
MHSEGIPLKFPVYIYINVHMFTYLPMYIYLHIHQEMYDMNLFGFPYEFKT